MCWGDLSACTKIVYVALYRVIFYAFGFYRVYSRHPKVDNLKTFFSLFHGLYKLEFERVTKISKIC